MPDLNAAVDWYREVLGFQVLMPPLRMQGPAIEKDMAEMIPGIVLRGAILGLPGGGDRVLELLEYPEHPGRARPPDASLSDHGLSHVGLLCDDLEKTRAELEAKGVEFLVSGIADIVGLRTSWFRDPYGVVYILLEKSRSERPYFAQTG